MRYASTRARTPRPASSAPSSSCAATAPSAPSLARHGADDDIGHQADQEEQPPPAIVGERVGDEPQWPRALRIRLRTRRRLRIAVHADRVEELGEREEDDQQERREESDRDEIRDERVLKQEH